MTNKLLSNVHVINDGSSTLAKTKKYQIMKRGKFFLHVELLSSEDTQVVIELKCTIIEFQCGNQNAIVSGKLWEKSKLNFDLKKILLLLDSPSTTTIL